MSSVLDAPEEDIRAAWDILHGDRDDERRLIYKSLSGDYVYKLDREHEVKKIPEGGEFPRAPTIQWIADEDLLETVSNERDIDLPSN